MVKSHHREHLPRVALTPNRTVLRSPFRLYLGILSSIPSATLLDSPRPRNFNPTNPLCCDFKPYMLSENCYRAWKDTMPRPTQSPMQELNDRQEQVLELISAGKRTKEIAPELNISERTVKWYITQLFRIYNATNRAELVARAGWWGTRR